MAGAPHDILVLALKEKPELLSELLRRVRGAGLPGPVVPVDSSVRFAVSLETYPDLVLATPGLDSTWFMVEVQNRKDERELPPRTDGCRRGQTVTARATPWIRRPVPRERAASPSFFGWERAGGW